MTEITFFVPGKPKPAGSKRAFVVKSKQSGKMRAIVTDANPQARDWKIDVQHVARTAYTGQPLEGPLELELSFFMERPKFHFNAKRDAIKPTAPSYPTGKPDASKLCRGVEDALTGMLYRDDSQIVKQTVRKRYATLQYREGVQVTVTKIT
jgi:crossover junction endodeoxyribonuclease RusA